MSTELHPWLATPEAAAAAKRAAQMPGSRLAAWSGIIGIDELESQALVILVECAQPKPQDVEARECGHCGDSLQGVRKGAKFCSRSCKSKYAVQVQRGKEETLAPTTHAHIGSMWDWPADQMEAYARTQVGYVLLNYVRSCRFAAEIRASDALVN